MRGHLAHLAAHYGMCPFGARGGKAHPTTPRRKGQEEEKGEAQKPEEKPPPHPSSSIGKGDENRVATQVV